MVFAFFVGVATFCACACLNISNLAAATTQTFHGKSNNRVSLQRRTVPVPVPNDTWQEHWFEHDQLLQLQFYDDNDAIYYDSDVDTSIVWPRTYFAQVWTYVKSQYGSFGPDTRLFVILHTLKYSGGHPSTFMDESHDYRNVIDCGSLDPNAWESGEGNDLDLTTHEVGHIVEGASKDVHGSPAFDIWHDSKWNEIFIYDVYLGLGRNDDAKRWYDIVISGSDDFPRANTHWFKDWFYPIYTQLGGQPSLNSFFELLSRYFPKHIYYNGTDQATLYEYDRDLNYGEFIHFWSGAAKVDLTPLALTAFGNLDEAGNDWTVQKQQAIIDFPDVNYNKDITDQSALTVSKENSNGSESNEGSSKLTDSLYSTKFFLGGYTNDFWAQLEFQKPQVVREYTITSGDDNPDRDPKTWNLYGSADGNSYIQVDSRTDEVFKNRLQTNKYQFNNDNAYNYYKLAVTSNAGSVDFQINELRLLQ